MKNKKNQYKSEIGFITSRKNELTDEFCVLYEAKKAGFDSTNGRWAIFCGCHGEVLTLKNKQIATSLLKEPEKWCNMCKSTQELLTAEHVINLRHERAGEDKLRLWANLVKNNPEKSFLFENMYGIKPDEFWD